MEHGRQCTKKKSSSKVTVVALLNEDYFWSPKDGNQQDKVEETRDIIKTYKEICNNNQFK